MDDETWRLLARHLAGESSPEEVEALEASLDEDTRAELDGLLRAVWTIEPPREEVPDAERGLRKLMARTGLSPVAGREAAKSARRRRAVRPEFLLRAAVLAGLSLLGVEAVTYSGQDFGSDPALLAPPRQVTSNRAESRRLVLSDGTQVLLAPASRLRFPSHFGSTHREVLLEGSAFFDVTREENRTFRVRTGDAVTQVLGTRFTVRAYSGETEVRVAVEEGTVALRERSGGDAGVILETGDLGIFDGGRVRRREGRAGPDVSWTRGRLAFRNRPVSHVLAELGRWFDVEFSADDSLRERLLTTSVGTRSVEEVVTILTTALDAEAVVEEGSIHLVRRREPR